MSLIEKLGTNQIALAIVLAAVLIGLSPVIADEILLNEYTTSLNADVEVVPPEGQNADIGVKLSNNLDYGKVPVNFSARKKVNISVNREGIARVSSKGNISEYLNYTDKVQLKKGVNRIEIGIEARDVGYYTGEVVLKTEMARSPAGKKWLEIKSWVYSRF